jgi:hypothetical protein
MQMLSTCANDLIRALCTFFVKGALNAEVVLLVLILPKCTLIF